MKQERISFRVFVNNSVVADCLNSTVASTLVEALSNKLANEKNVTVSFAKTTYLVDVPDPKPESGKKAEEPKTDAKKSVKPTEEDLKKKN